jgi:FMN phosphatase YigB (HAD superfamily)
MMNKLFLFFTIFFISSPFVQGKIKHIFIDPNVIFITSHGRAAGYIGSWKALKYMNHTGHLPGQEYLFQDLKDVPAQSKILTYDEGLEAPLIISDWLLGTAQEELTRAVEKYLDASSLSEIEKTIHLSTTKMMFDPISLADIQKIRPGIEKLLRSLKNKKYSIYLAGNWTDIIPLKKRFSHIFELIDGVYISSEMKLLKPQKEFWESVLSLSGCNAEECLCIEAEPVFFQATKQIPCQSIFYENGSNKKLRQALKNYGVNLSA